MSAILPQSAAAVHSNITDSGSGRRCRPLSERRPRNEGSMDAASDACTAATCGRGGFATDLPTLSQQFDLPSLQVDSLNAASTSEMSVALRPSLADTAAEAPVPTANQESTMPWAFRFVHQSNGEPFFCMP